MNVFRRAVSALLLLSLSTAFALASQKASYRHYLQALLLSNQGNYPEALREYEAALELDPESAFMLEQAADLALEMGQADRALEFASRLVKYSPKNGKAFFLLGNIHWARGDLEAAKIAFEKTLELDPDFSQALYTLGNLLSSQSPESAKQYLQDYLARNPDNASDAEFQIAVIEQRAGRDDDAIGHLRSAIELNPENMHAHYALAQIYEVRRDTAAALEVYSMILEYDSRNVALLNHVGEIYYLVDDIEAAAEHFQRAKDIMPSNPTSCLWLALLAEQKEDFKAAAAHVAASSALEQEASLNLRLSYYLTQDGRLKEAVEVLEKAHAHWPKNEEVSYFLALGYDDLKMAEKAVVLMREVLDIRPDHRDARFQLGALYEKLGDIPNMEIQFREILQAHPDDASALNFLGYTLADRGLKLEEAESLIRRAVELNPNNGAYADSLGWVHFRRGRSDDALRELQGAARMMPNDDAIWSHLGEVLEKLGRNGDAWLAWKKSQLYAPRTPSYGKRAAKLESKLDADELGRGYQEFLGEALGNVASYGGPCVIRGEVGGKAFTFQGILHYKAPWDMSIDIMGPLFVPVFGIAMSGMDGFEMDPLDIEGVSQEMLRENLFAAVRLMRDYLEGGLFRNNQGDFRRGWRHSHILTPKGTLYLNKERTEVASIAAAGEPAFRLHLSDYGRVRGHWVPARLKIQGKGFSMEFHISNPNVTFGSAARVETPFD